MRALAWGRGTACLICGAEGGGISWSPRGRAESGQWSILVQLLKQEGGIPHAAHLTWVVPLAGGGVVCGRAPSKGSSVLRVIQKRAKTTPRTP